MLLGTMTEPLKTYSIRVRRQDELKYGQWVTAPTEEEAVKLFINEYLDVRFVKDETEAEKLRRENTELRSEIDTLKAFLRNNQ